MTAVNWSDIAFVGALWAGVIVLGLWWWSLVQERRDRANDRFWDGIEKWYQDEREQAERWDQKEEHDD